MSLSTEITTIKYKWFAEFPQAIREYIQKVFSLLPPEKQKFGLPFMTIRIALEGIGHITLFFLKDATAEKIAELFEALHQADALGKLSGSLSPIEFAHFGPKLVLLVKFVGEIAETHKTLFQAGIESGTVVSEMPKSEQEKLQPGEIAFTAHITDPKVTTLEVISLKGCAVELKCLGPFDPVCRFIIGEA